MKSYCDRCFSDRNVEPWRSGTELCKKCRYDVDVVCNFLTAKGFELLPPQGETGSTEAPIAHEAPQTEEKSSKK